MYSALYIPFSMYQCSFFNLRYEIFVYGFVLKYSVHNSVLRIFAFKVQLTITEGKANIISLIPIELLSKQRYFIFYKQASNKHAYKTIILCNETCQKRIRQ